MTPINFIKALSMFRAIRPELAGPLGAKMVQCSVAKGVNIPTWMYFGSGTGQTLGKPAGVLIRAGGKAATSLAAAGAVLGIVLGAMDIREGVEEINNCELADKLNKSE